MGPEDRLIFQNLQKLEESNKKGDYKSFRNYQKALTEPQGSYILGENAPLYLELLNAKKQMLYYQKNKLH